MPGARGVQDSRAGAGGGKSDRIKRPMNAFMVSHLFLVAKSVPGLYLVFAILSWIPSQVSETMNLCI